MTAEEKRAYAAALMKGRAGRNRYTNGGKRRYFFGYPSDGEDGYSDCSSAVRACIQKAAGVDIGSNTDGQLRNYGKGIVVDSTSGAYPDESKLLPGDCLYFKGNSRHFKDVGHVEMYTGPNECWGHGSGVGPTKKDLKEYCRKRAANGRRYFAAVRWILDEDGAEAFAPSDPVKEEHPGWVVVSAAGTWRIRAGASLASKTLGFAKQGERLRCYGLCGNWAAVRTEDGRCKGWIAKKAVKRAVTGHE